jgi:superfamily I DNA/RNA helicase
VPAPLRGTQTGSRRARLLDLLIKARDLVRDNADVCREFRERFRVILVDEFQDTDPLQAELLLKLTSADDGTIRPGRLIHRR